MLLHVFERITMNTFFWSEGGCVRTQRTPLVTPMQSILLYYQRCVLPRVVVGLAVVRTLVGVEGARVLDSRVVVDSRVAVSTSISHKKKLFYNVYSSDLGLN